MKKIFIFTVILLTATCCFAKNHKHYEDYDSEDIEISEDTKSKNVAFFIDVGRAGWQTDKLGLVESEPLKRDLWATNTFFEIGKFNSKEDGFFNWVNWSLGGFGFGKINTWDNFGYVTRNTDTYLATEDAKYFKLWSNESVGAQITFFHFSAAALIGIKSFMDFTSFDAYCKTADLTSKLYGISGGFEFSPSLYVSFNFLSFAKLFVLYNVSLPIFRVRYVASKDSTPACYKNPTAEFFKGDCVNSVMVGVAFFF